MTTKTFDTTVSQLLQDNSSVEYVAPETNPIATIPTVQNEERSVSDLKQTSLFNLHAEHNGEHCIASLDPKDTRENRFWFTVAMLVTIYNESDKTIRNNIEELAQEGELGDCKIFQRRVNIEDSCGVPHPTTIYNLTVLNRLGMCCFRKNKEAKKVRDKFNDVLVKHETQAQPQPQFALPTTYLEALEALVASEKAKLALQAERDEAIRTKARIGSQREATAMATASAKARECEKLREQIGDSETYKRATAIPWLSEYFDTRNDGLYNSLAAQLKKVEASMPPEFAHKPTPDSRFGSVKAYHVAVIEKFHEIVREKIPVDKKFMAKYRKDVSSQSENA